ncbi:MAG TPA: DNA polymerase [Bacteroidetes bacterium]|nr:DNA polymerase [Bacteroidota bacterium]
MSKPKSRKKTPARELPRTDPVLYGQSTLQKIVAIQLLNDSTVRLYSRGGGAENAAGAGRVTSTDAEFYPFFFLSSPSLIEGFSKKFWLKELAGSNFYRFLVAFQRWNDLWEAVRFVMQTYNRTALKRASHYSEIDPLLLKPDPLSQYLLQSGVTLFKEMTFDELRRVQIRIAAHSKAGKRSDPRKTEDRILAAALTDNTGWEQTFDGRKLSEPEILRGVATAIAERDPDVIEGHDLFDQVLPYLILRSELHSLDLALGRDQSALRSFSPRGNPLESPSENAVYEIAGRHLLDTKSLAHAYASSKRPFEQYGLRYLLQHLNLPQTQEHPAASQRQTSETPSEQADSLVVRLRSECTDISTLSRHLTPSYFFQARMVPLAFDALLRSGSAAKIEKMMLREYVRQKHSVPKTQTGTQHSGGYTDIFVTGILPNVLSADIESLYPSIMLTQNIKPSSDELGTFTQMLQVLTASRLEAKRRMKTTESERERESLDAFQSSLKILINSFYGYLGYARGLFNDFEQADRITSVGQALLRTIIHEVEMYNGRVIEADTDGIFFIPPDNVRGESQEEAFIERLSASLPTGINLVLAGRYKKMVSYRKKNYALLDYSDRLTIKGSSLISRSLERFAKEYIALCINCLLQEDIGGMHKLYVSLAQDITNHNWEVYDFCRTETIRDSIESYEADLRDGQRKPSAAYEVAKRSGIIIKPGDRVSYYVTGTQAGVKIVENSKLAEDWRPNFPDENTPYYLERLNESSKKFDLFFSPKDFERIFSTEDLFGFDANQVRLITDHTIPRDQASQPEEDTGEFGIWIDESG